MNDIFKIKRFGLLLKKTVLERPMQYVGLIGLIFVLTLVIYGVALYALSWMPAQNLAFIWGFVGGGCFLSSVVFGYFNTNASGSAYLTLPASAFKKWLCAVLIIGVFFPGMFLAFYKLMDICFVTVYHNGLNKYDPHFKDLYNMVAVFSFNNKVTVQSEMLYMNFVGAMMIGSLYFNKTAAIKTSLVYCGILGVIFFLNLFIANALFKDVDIAFPFHNIFIKVGTDSGSLELPHRVENMVTLAIQFIVPGILWLTALMRLREKEI